MDKIKVISKRVIRFKRELVLVLTPLILLPVLYSIPLKQAKCLYVFLVMVTYWCTEALPVAVTSLIPIVIFPTFGIMASSKVCPQYFADTIILFMGGVILAVAMENWNLHRRVALHILMYVGVKPTMLLLGLMLTTSILSMWMNNSATTVTMMPIANAILKTLYGDEESTDMSVSHINAGTRENLIANPVQRSFAVKGILLSIPYSASIGGIATLTGSVPNLILDGQVKRTFPNSHTLTFGSWLLFALPFMLLLLLSAWLWISILYGGLQGRYGCCHPVLNTVLTGSDCCVLSCRFAEKAVGFVFLLFVIILFTRSPKYMLGWEKIFQPKYVSDAAASTLIIILLFIFPSQKPTYKWKIDPSGMYMVPLLSWKTVQKKVPWNVLILLGGGFALAKGTEESELSVWIGDLFQPLEKISASAAVLLISLTVSVVTEFLNSSVTSAVLLPVLAKLTESCCNLCSFLYSSFAFTLPSGTPENTIAFSSRQLHVKDMVKGGIVLNVWGNILLFLAINTWGQPIFQLTRKEERVLFLNNVMGSLTSTWSSNRDLGLTSHPKNSTSNITAHPQYCTGVSA
uniref:Solute carrier family 13 member 3-like n=1 Tax=Callorhinchus milii TaxID=7868 RepID=A0A4W3J830_CALMI